MSDQNDTNPPGKNPLGVGRVFAALGYSLDGLRHAASREPAFQQELMFLAAATLLALILPIASVFKLALVVMHLFILVVELLNSAIEAIVDKASPEYHELAKQAKDMGSAAVLLAFLMAVVVWIAAIWPLVG